MGSVLDLAADVARAVARQIHVQVTPVAEGRDAGRQSVNPAVAEAYLKGRYYLGKGTDEGMRRASGYFEQALAVDPAHAPSHSGLADYYILTDAIRPEEAFAMAKRHALEALTLDETLPDAHASLAFVRHYDEWDWAGAEQQFARALELNPGHARTRRWYGVFLSAMGRHTEAIDQVRRALAIDPVAIANLDALASVQFNARQYKDAVATGSSIMELDRHDPRAHEHQALGLLQLGEPAAALAVVDRALPPASTSTVLQVIRTLCLGRLGQAEEAERELTGLERRSAQQYVPGVFLAIARADRGDSALAIDHLEKAFANRDPYLVLLHVSPWFDPLRSDPRFQTLHERLAFPK
jgi:tetratricopeptide (TPR) repeat protein